MTGNPINLRAVTILVLAFEETLATPDTLTSNDSGFPQKTQLEPASEAAVDPKWSILFVESIWNNSFALRMGVSERFSYYGKKAQTINVGMRLGSLRDDSYCFNALNAGY